MMDLIKQQLKKIDITHWFGLVTYIVFVTACTNIKEDSNCLIDSYIESTSLNLGKDEILLVDVIHKIDNTSSSIIISTVNGLKIEEPSMAYFTYYDGIKIISRNYKIENGDMHIYKVDNISSFIDNLKWSSLKDQYQTNSERFKESNKWEFIYDIRSNCLKKRFKIPLQ